MLVKKIYVKIFNLKIIMLVKLKLKLKFNLVI